MPEYKNESWYDEVPDTLLPTGQLDKRNVGDAAVRELMTILGRTWFFLSNHH